MKIEIAAALVSAACLHATAGTLTCETELVDTTNPKQVTSNGNINISDMSRYSKLTVCTSGTSVKAMDGYVLSVIVGNQRYNSTNNIYHPPGSSVKGCPAGMTNLVEGDLPTIPNGTPNKTLESIGYLQEQVATVAKDMKIRTCLFNPTVVMWLCNVSEDWKPNVKHIKSSQILSDTIEGTWEGGENGRVRLGKYSGDTSSMELGLPRVTYSIRSVGVDGIKVYFDDGKQEIETDINKDQYVNFDIPKNQAGGTYSRIIDATVTCP